MKVLVNKGTLLSEVRPLLLFSIVSQTSRECGWRVRCLVTPDGDRLTVVERPCCRRRESFL